MAEEKIHNVDVRLRYAVTGSESAAEKFLRGMYQTQISIHGGMETEHRTDFTARFICSDVNPGEVEGYRNYETFTIGVWLKNDRKLYERCRNEAKNTLLILQDHGDKLEDLTPEVTMADWLKLYVETLLQVDQREEKARTDAERMFVSLTQAALDRVDWLGIAEEWIVTAQEG